MLFQSTAFAVQDTAMESLIICECNHSYGHHYGTACSLCACARDRYSVVQAAIHLVTTAEPAN